MAITADDATAQVIALIARIVDRYSREYEAAGARHDLTVTQVKALLALDEPVPMREIAQRIKAEPSNATPVIDRLEARGLVERRSTPGDRRKKLVATTESGHAVVVDLRRHLPFVGDPLAALDDGQRATLRDLLTLVAGP
jgi:DNA-binding MarR family transcriptional regulator